VRLSDLQEPVINRHLECTCDGLKFRSGGFGGKRVKLIQANSVQRLEVLTKYTRT
jgi:hypothetical protein